MGTMGAVRKWVGLTGAASILAFGLAATVDSAPSGASNSGPKGSYGSLPSSGGKAKSGGTITIGEDPGAGPTYIFPIFPEANASVYDSYQFAYYMWRPLWWSPKGANPTIDYSQSISPKAPVFSNGNKTVTITLSPNWKWSDGTAVTSTDLAFYVDMVKAAVGISPANDGDYTPGLFPDNVTSMSTPNPTTFVLTFAKSYNQSFLFYSELAGAALTPLPAQAWAKTSATGPIVDFTNPANAKAIYTFLNAQSNSLSTYSSNPLWQTVDGPYKIASFDTSTDANTLVANHAYSGPSKPKIETIDDVAFTSVSSEFNQLLTGKLDVAPVDYSDLPQVPKLEGKGYSVWGYPNLGLSDVEYNFKDTTGHFSNIIAQLYFRQALAHLQNQTAVIKSKGIFNGAAGPAYGPAPAIPPTPFTPKNALSNPYPFSISAASKLLTDHGWKVKPGGSTVCEKAGSGRGECGAGIPKGTPISFNLIYANSVPSIGAQDEALASNAKDVGITIKLQGKTFNYLINNLSDVGSPDNDNVWAMQDYGGLTLTLYPTTNEIFNTGGSFNDGGGSNKTIDADITASENSSNPNAVKKELSDITRLQPGLFQPNPDLLYAFKKGISGPAFSFEAASQYQFEPEYWYFTK